ncbi:hypothetical protein [Pseudoalteromonas piscicida]|uniref:hypothetical protein n=1 Tax=Pseudoalteromonas piscicida TaxID=43662 RepID=UPI0012486E7B|nr:hypothetical protein [Pseudoalteromonas piscicida]
MSDTLYQMDVYSGSGAEASMGEAKDYTVQGKKVGRGDLQKLGGALPDIKEINSGKFFSATGYTLPARKYADNSEGIVGKPIELYELRPSIELDENNFISSLIIEGMIYGPDRANIKITPHFTEQGKKELRSLLKAGENTFSYRTQLQYFYDSQGNELLNLFELTSNGYGDIHEVTGMSHGCYILEGAYIKVHGLLVAVHCIEFEVPYITDRFEAKITDDRELRLTVIDSKGCIIAGITDDGLRAYEFDNNGLVKKAN